MYLLDTNAIIYYSRGERVATEHIEHWLAADELLLTSTIVEAELFSWPDISTWDVRKIDQMLETVVVIPVYSPIARAGAQLRRTYRIHLADSLIAATAMLHHAALVTRNAKHFSRIKEIDLIAI